MADKEKDKKIVPPKLPKTNYQTWIILALIVVIFGVSRLYNNGELTEVGDSRFDEMVRSRDINQARPAAGDVPSRRPNPV